MPVNKCIQRIKIPCPTGDLLEAVLMLPSRDVPRRLVYIVPLVGAGASQQILRFKSMTKRGAALLSFDYRGHGMSSGAFSMRKSLEDSLTVYHWAQNYASVHGLPLHALATCYGSLVMLSWFQDGDGAQAAKTLGSVSSLLDLHSIIRVDEFIPYYEKNGGPAFSRAGQLIEEMKRGTVDIHGKVFRLALRDYLKSLFPELRVTPDAFEDLEYSRADIQDTIIQFSTMTPLEGAVVPAKIPGLFFFGLHDTLMKLDSPEGRKNHESRIKKLAPHAEIRAAAIDHFGRGPDHDSIIQQLCDFHEEHETA